MTSAPATQPAPVFPAPASEEAFPSPAADRVGRLTRTGAKWSVALLIVRQCITLVATAVVARILPASDFGMVAMVGTLTSFLMLISDMGLSWATVQKERLERDQIDLVFWAGFFFGGLAWAACALGAPLLARFYKTPELVPLCWVLGLSLFLNGLAIQPTALLKRQMRQRELALSQTASVLAAGVVAVVLALAGAGYWALAVQTITAGLVLLIMSLGWSGYRPGVPRLSAGALSLLKFGGYVGACNVLSYVQLNLDSILIGRYGGADELGFYSRAFYLRALPAMYAAMALTDVMVPALSAIQGDRQRLELAFTKTVRLIAFVGCPIAAGLGVTAEESVRLLYGPNWLPVVPLLIWLSFPALVLPLTQTMGWLFIASGKVRMMFILSASTVPVVIVAYGAAVAWGALGIAIAVAALYTIPMPLLTAYYAHKAAGLSLRRTLKAVTPILLACVGSAAAALAVGSAGHALAIHWIPLLGAKITAGALVYFLLATWLIRPLPIGPLELLAERLRRIGLSSDRP